MKNFNRRKTVWRSLFSATILAVFIYFALGSLGGAQQKRYLGDGVYEIAKNFGNGTQEVITGKTDTHGNFHGTTTFKRYNENGDLVSSEEINMTNGLRNGTATIYVPGKGYYQVCYEMGERVECEKSASAGEGKSAFEIFAYRYPWMMLNFELLYGLAEDDVKAYTDTLEIMLEETVADISGFDNGYEDAVDMLSDTHFDSIVNANSELTFHNGIELSKFDEFRYAVIDRYLEGRPGTFDVVKNSYPGYLRNMNLLEIMDNDFMLFCHVFDSVMFTYGNVDIKDPDVVDTLDNRMFRALSLISSGASTSLVQQEALKSADLKSIKNQFPGMNRMAVSLLTSSLPEVAPPDIADVIIAFILIKYVSGDLIRKSLYEVHSLKLGIPLAPTVTTAFLSRNSNSGVTISGNIVSDGGAEVMARGIYWGTVYNPDSTNSVVLAGSGTGKFQVELKNLSNGVVYYARAYAKNGAGTGLGNTLAFTANGITGIAEPLVNVENFSLFPNPASEKTNLHLKMDRPAKTKISVVNINGQIVLRKDFGLLPGGENILPVDISGLQSGSYFVRVSIENKQDVRLKLSVTR